MNGEDLEQYHIIILLMLGTILLISLPGLIPISDSEGDIVQNRVSNVVPAVDAHAVFLDAGITGEESAGVGVVLDQMVDQRPDGTRTIESLYVHLLVGESSESSRIIYSDKMNVPLHPGEGSAVIFDVSLENKVYDRGYAKSKVPVWVYVSRTSSEPSYLTLQQSRDTMYLGELTVSPELYYLWSFWGVALSVPGLLITFYRSRKNHDKWKTNIVERGKKLLAEIEEASAQSSNRYYTVDYLLTDHTPYEFEQVIERLYRAKNYRVRRTSKGGDAGLDVLARRGDEYIGIQVKRYSPENKVGSPEVQNAVGAAIQQGCHRVVVVTTSDFTGPAVTAARATSRNGMKVTLLNGRKTTRELNRYL